MRSYFVLNYQLHSKCILTAKEILTHISIHTLQCSLYIMDTLVQESLSVIQRCLLCGGYEVILYSKECNWYTRCCPLNGGVRYRECPLREAMGSITDC